jgi:hypothetical protein
MVLSVLCLDAELFRTVPFEATALADAIEVALANCRGSKSIAAVDLRRHRSPVLKAAGVKSLAQFEHGLKYCTAHKAEAQYRIQPFKPVAQGGGFEPTEEARRIPLAPGFSGIVEALLEVLR